MATKRFPPDRQRLISTAVNFGIGGIRLLLFARTNLEAPCGGASQQRVIRGNTTHTDEFRSTEIESLPVTQIYHFMY